MGETIPALRFRVYPSVTESGDLGGKSENTWTDSQGQEENRVYLHYSFHTASGYASRKEDYSSEGAAIHYDYDLSSSAYAKKRQFVLGAYVYVKRKSLSYEGDFPSAVLAYMSGSNDCSPKVLPRGVSAETLAETDLLFQELTENQYHAVSRQYLYPQPALSGKSLYNDEDYVLDAEVVFSGAAGAYPPYLDVAAEDVIPYAVQVSPNGSFADKSDDIVLSWELAYDKERYAKFDGVNSQTELGGAVYGTLKQKEARLRWTEDGSTIHEIYLGEETQAVIPAGSITADSFRWQVLLCSDDGVWSTEESEWYSVFTDNDEASTATPVYPKNISIQAGESNVFRWEHHIASGTRPSGADLQYSVNGGESWTNFAEYRGRDCSCEVPANRLPAGELLWRVRTYNAIGAAGAWSDSVELTVLGGSDLPQFVSIGSEPLPDIVWRAEGQLAAEIELDGQTERVYSEEQYLRWPHILRDGTHLLRLRVQNEYALWSAWAETTVETKNIPSEKPKLHVQERNNSLVLIWDGQWDRVLIERNGTFIYEVTECQQEEEQSWVDYQSVGVCRYRIRGVRGAYYADSDERQGEIQPDGALLGQNGTWLAFLGRYGAVVQQHCRMEETVLYRYYSGDTFPFAYPKGQRNCVHTFTFSLPMEEKDKLACLQAWSGCLLIYKDCNHNCIYGLLEQVESDWKETYVDVSFCLRECRQEKQSRAKKET